jgi:hypothetical protein
LFPHLEVIDIIIQVVF